MVIKLLSYKLIIVYLCLNLLLKIESNFILTPTQKKNH